MLKKVINSNFYQDSDIIEKEKKLFSFFHSSIFSSISVEERLALMQELENVEAKKQSRPIYNVTAGQANGRLMNAGVVFHTKEKPGKIIFNRKYLFEGKEEVYNPTTKEIVYTNVKGFNMRLLDTVLHEQFHALFHHILSELDPNKGEIYRELKEYKAYFACHVVTEKQQQSDIKKGYYLYITNPDEYYAFKYAYENVLRIFEYLYSQYGIDASIENYKNYQKQTRAITEKSFFNDTGVQVNYEEIYKILLNNWALKFAQNNGFNTHEVLYDIGKSKKLLDRYHIF